MTQGYQEADFERVVRDVGRTYFLPETTIEIIREPELKAPPQHVLFDFDGTLSLIREGWPGVMVPMMVEVLLETGTDESPQELYDYCYGYVMQLCGKQTIYQMVRLAEEVKARGGTPKDPFVYKQIYHDRLMDRIRHRREALRSGKVKPEEMLVPCSLNILAALKDRGIALYLASGTDQEYVEEEAGLLTLEHYFGPHIYGAQKEYKKFSKQAVIDHILSENRIEGSLLLGFGDGYVEIQNVKSSGGTAIAVASDEAHRSGKPDAWKRDRLIGAGADIVIPDFQDYEPLLRYLRCG
jgi:phosphoglycolate phosphatase-like HAD superfamily hydrolase